MIDAAWELEKVAVINRTATGDESPSFGNHGFLECIRGSEMMDTTTISIIEEKSAGKDSDNIPIGFNGIELSVWEKKNPDRMEGVTIELVSRCASTPRDPDDAHHMFNSGNALQPSMRTLKTANWQTVSSVIIVPQIIPNGARLHVILIIIITRMLLCPISQSIPVLKGLRLHISIDSMATDVPKRVVRITHDILTKRIETMIIVSNIPIPGSTGLQRSVVKTGHSLFKTGDYTFGFSSRFGTHEIMHGMVRFDKIHSIFLRPGLPTE
ncbi:hypothetical protein BGAL_0299g00020 [Botrytis galanthina]|uniref:Uncharacterized protein n=1 Tax=Botrytis galanthina TaxID=278940 RepID=A0A4S8QR27_9HELO|nr:hypothetical protein BGAL_0299g00020 [Botrytis galanthina]